MAAVTFNEGLEQHALKLFRERAAMLSTQIGAGAMTYDAYKFNCGVLKGLQEAQQLLTEALSDLQKANRGA